MQDLVKSDGIRVNCICPGMVNTAMVKDMFTDQSPLSKDVQDYVKATMLRWVLLSDYFWDILDNVFSNKISLLCVS